LHIFYLAETSLSGSGAPTATAGSSDPASSTANAAANAANRTAKIRVSIKTFSTLELCFSAL
jgi:hypothetical protein